MPAASHRDIALQKLANGEISAAQFHVLESKLFPPERPAVPPAPAPVQPWALPLMQPVAKPAEAPTPAPSHPDPAQAALLDYLKAHPEPNPNHKQNVPQRTTHPGAAPRVSAPSPSPSTPTNVAADIDRLVARSR